MKNMHPLLASCILQDGKKINRSNSQKLKDITDMKKLVKNFSQYINECGCTDGKFLPEAEGDMGLDTTGTGVADQTNAMVMEEDEDGDDSEFASEGQKVVVTVKDSRGNFQELMNKIKELSEEGVSFEIAITPEGSDDEGVERFFWDSDGDDAVESIEVEGEEEFSDDSEEDVDDAEYEDEDDDEDSEDLEENFKEGDAVGVKIKDMKGPQTGGKHVVNENLAEIGSIKRELARLKNNKHASKKQIAELENDLKKAQEKAKNAKKVNEKTITQKDGSYPISGKESLRKAQHAFGRSKNKVATKKHIVSAAKKLGLADELSDKWK